jgi:hypothetical protein
MSDKKSIESAEAPQNRDRRSFSNTHRFMAPAPPPWLSPGHRLSEASYAPRKHPTCPRRAAQA